MAQADKAQFERERADLIAPGDIVPLDEAKARKADQIRVGLGRRHSCFAGKIAQHHRLADAGQRLQQPAADFDRLDAAAFHAVDARALPPEICRPAM